MSVSLHCRVRFHRLIHCEPRAVLVTLFAAGRNALTVIA
jgi:hypothetical protein